MKTDELQDRQEAQQVLDRIKAESDGRYRYFHLEGWTTDYNGRWSSGYNVEISYWVERGKEVCTARGTGETCAEAMRHAAQQLPWKGRVL